MKMYRTIIIIRDIEKSWTQKLMKLLGVCVVLVIIQMFLSSSSKMAHLSLNVDSNSIVNMNILLCRYTN